ncbi:MAG: DUF962 domain-containing protein [Phycisphaerae bacterium]|nr:DUF962 domain-containing protein [Phycisphaerae bacterium]NUQ47398.1 DUF962 domain-containing protein [Phycisphaerae bacterium]
MPRWLSAWLERHQHPASLALHVVGIPLTIACIPLAIAQLVDNRWDLWWRPAGLLVGGYALQWLGHVIEGNDMGEVILIKRWLGRPYVAVAPRYQREDSAADDGTA